MRGRRACRGRRAGRARRRKSCADCRSRVSGDRRAGLDFPAAFGKETTMIQLCGLAISNYYNKVKFALLEKGVPFEECPVRTGGGEEMRCHSPLAKIPYISTEQGSLCESQAIVDWLEATHPTPALISSDPWRAAKTRELMVFM